MRLPTVLFALALVVTGPAAAQERIAPFDPDETWVFSPSDQGDVFGAGDMFRFDSTDAAMEIIERIMSTLALAPRFEVYRAPVQNAAARIEAGNVRVIYYSESWVRRTIANDEWMAITLLAHEIGHHLNNHTFQGASDRVLQELEADRFAGATVARLGGTLDDAQRLYLRLPARGGPSHPPRAARLEAVAVGWVDVADGSFDEHEPQNSDLADIALHNELASLALPTIDVAFDRETNSRVSALAVLRDVDGERAGYLIVSNASGSGGPVAIRVSEAGERLWFRVYDLPAYARGAAATGDGGYVITGSIQRSEDRRDTVAWVGRFDHNGQLLWERTFGTEERSGLYDVAVADTGEIAAIGYPSMVLLTPEGDLLAEPPVAAFVVQAQSGGAFWFGGMSIEQRDPITLPLLRAPTLGRVDLFGAVRQVRSWPLQPTIDSSPALTFTADGDVIWAAIRNQTGDYDAGFSADLGVERITPTGATRWWVDVPTPDVASPRSLLALPGGDVVILAELFRPQEEDPHRGDLWLVRVSPDGEVVAAREIDGGGYESAVDIVARADGGAVVLATVVSSDDAPRRGPWLFSIAPDDPLVAPPR